MKKYIMILQLAVLALMFGCAENEEAPRETYPMEAFRLLINNYVYHAEIDQSAHTATIGSIQYGGQVTGVDYSLAEGATIAPDPQQFVGDWPATQTVAVTVGEETTNYTVTLPAYIGKEPAPQTKVIFEDDFEQEGSIPDPEKWVLCTAGNSPWDKYMSGSYDQAYVEDGKLVLKAERIDGQYKAGGIQSMNKAWFKHARIEVKARFTKTAQGSWPAIWLMPQHPIYQGWPDCGEVDIMEYLNHDEIVYQTVHSNYTYDLKITDPSNTVSPTFNIGAFNTYGVDLTEEYVIFHVNGVETLRYPNLHLENEAEMMQWPFDADFYLILNVALGGEGTWPGVITDSELPACMEVDWVRVTELE